MPIPLLALAGISAGAQLVGRLFGKSAADKRKEEESKRIDAEYKGMSDKLAAGYKSLKDTQEGQTSIDPEAAANLAATEKISANAQSKGFRSATSTGDAASVVNSVAGYHLNKVLQINAAMGSRRRAAAENAAKTGLAGDQAQVNLEQQKQATKRGAYNDVNQSTAADTDFLGSLGSDLVSGAMYDKYFSSKAIS